jgi:DNA-binding SARP family transcriptional activator
MGHLSLALLGPPEICHAGALLALPTRKALALLLFLAVEGGQHSRDRLAALLWPETGAARGRASLRLNLNYLRRALGHEGSEPGHLVIERDSLAFNSDADFELDLALVAAALASAQYAAGPATATSQHERLRAAARELRGEFLAGFSLSDAPEFDDWAGLQRELWHRRSSQVLERLALSQAERGERAEAIQTALRWAAHDSLNEDAHRQLMRLYLAGGERAAALRVYERWRETLARELGVKPAPETAALAERARQTPESQAEAGRGGVPGAQRRPQDAPLVGRADEHSVLAAAFDAARQGRPQAVVLEGEPGIGKTRLAAEFLRWATAQGAAVLHGRAFEVGGRLPYQPLVDALRSHLEHPSPGERSGPVGITQLGPTWLAELARLLPELREALPHLPAPASGEPAEAQLQLFEAVARLGRTLAASGPVVLLVDDVQWADLATLDCLSYLARRWHATGTAWLLLLTLRSEEVPGLGDWLAGLDRALPVTRLALGPLGLAAIQQLADAVAVKVAAEVLLAETHGHPLYLVETLKTLQAGHALTPGQMPGGIRKVITAQLAGLGPGARGLLNAAAVVGDGYAFEVLARVAQWEAPASLAALDDLFRRGLLRESAGAVFFAHDQVRQITYAEAGVARQRVLHSQALQILTDAGAAPIVRARHALAAGLREQAYHLLVSAGDDAMRLFAVRQAVDHYEQALALAREAGGARPADELAVHLGLQLGRAYELINERKKASSVYEDVLRLARRAGQKQSECTALNRLASVAQHQLELGAARDLLHQAAAVAEASGDVAGLAETEWNLARVSHYSLQLEAALAHGTHALGLAQQLGGTELIARSLNALALTKLELGRLPEAEREAGEAARLYGVLGNRALEADSLSLVADAQIRSGRATLGRATARDAQAIAHEIANAWGQANTAQQVALALIELGRFAEAEREAQAGLAAARSAGFEPLVVYNLLVLGSALRGLGRLDAARQAHAEALQRAAGPGGEWFALQARAELCADDAASGTWQAALRFAHDVFAAGERGLLYTGLLRPYLIAAVVQAGKADDLETAVADLERLRQAAGDNPRFRIAYLQACALLPAPARARLGAGSARECLETAAALARQLGLPDDAGRQGIANVLFGDAEGS